VSKVALKVIDVAVKRVYGGKRKISWLEVKAGESAFKEVGEWLPQETLDAIQRYFVTLKGPLTTPVGGGIRSLNVAIRRELDLYACVRPCRWIKGVPAPVKNPEALDIVIFRENTEDVYSGIEWKMGTPEADKMRGLLKREMGIEVSADSGIGVKPISKSASQRLVRAAIKYAVGNNRKSVTLVHKGNIMKFTEGAFREWGYEVAKGEFSGKIITEEELTGTDASPSRKRIIVKDRLADSMFQQVLLRPEDYDVIATTNLNGDYLSDACAAQVGGIGLSPSANINYESGIAVFEPTHGTAPTHAGVDEANPCAMILTGVMMLEYLGWSEAARLIRNGLESTIMQKRLTYDLARNVEGSRLVKCSEFGDYVLRNMQSERQ
jgi:isocitrate dehydrogenase